MYTHIVRIAIEIIVGDRHFLHVPMGTVLNGMKWVSSFVFIMEKRTTMALVIRNKDQNYFYGQARENGAPWKEQNKQAKQNANNKWTNSW